MSRARQVLISAAAIVALSVLVAEAVVAKPSGPGPGNSPNAKACQKGGWEELADENGDGFASNDECVAYAAQGGELQPKPAGEEDLTLSPGTLTSTSASGTKNYTYDFGFSNATQTFTVKNEGTGASNQLTAQLEPVPAWFSESNDTCTGQVLAPGDTCTFDITYTAPAACDSGEPVELRPGEMRVGPNDLGDPYIFLTLLASCRGS